MEEKRPKKKGNPANPDKTVSAGSGGRAAKEISLWALLARGSIYKIVMVLSVMAAAEIALFYGSLRWKMESGRIADALFETIFDSDFKIWFFGGSSFLFMAAFCLVAFLLHRCETINSGSIFYYTFDRLRVTRQHLFLVETAYNFLCLTLVFAVQTWTVLAMCRIYADRVPTELASPQMVFLAFYRIPFLHNLLPLAETGKWVRNLLLLFAVSMGATERGMKNYFQYIYPVIIFALWWNLSGIGAQWSDIFMSLLFSVIILVTSLQAWGIIGGDKSIEEPEGDQL